MVQPAPSGTTVSPGDEIRTLSASGAVITFFTGTEIELGNETILVVERVSRQGERIDVSLRQVFGISVSHMQTFADSGSAYRVDSGGAVALVRGSQLAVYGPQEGLSIFINVESTQPITVENCTLMPGVGVWFEVPIRDRGCNYFRAALEAGPWNALLEGFTTAEQARQGDTRRRPAGQVQAGRVNETRSDIDKQKKDDDSLPTPTTTPGTASPTATGTATSSTAASPTPGGGTGTAVPCNNATNSGGEGVTTTVHALGQTSGTFKFIRDAFGIPDRFEVIYEGHVLLDTGDVSGAATHSITYGPGTSTNITVRVTGPTGTAWTYTVSCPT